MLVLLVLVESLPSSAQTVIKVEEKDGVYMVPCKVNGLDLKFIFDTGASDVSLSLTEASFMMKNGHLQASDFVGVDRYEIASGEIIEGFSVNLRSIVVGEIEIVNVKASIIKNTDAPLLLGQSAISKLGAFNFDYENRTIVFGGGVVKPNPPNPMTLDRRAGCIDGNCSNGYGTYSWANGQKYIGEFRKGRFHGLGRMFLPEGQEYSGYYKNGMRHGRGIHKWPSGEYYDGEWHANAQSGWGEQIFPNGQRHEGYYRSGMMEGQGTRTWPNGEKYVGHWMDNKKHGKGTHLWPDGRKYVGEFRNGKPNGKGTLIWYGGAKYQGTFLNGKCIDCPNWPVADPQTP